MKKLFACISISFLLMSCYDKSKIKPLRTSQNTETVKKDSLNIPTEYKEAIGAWHYNINGLYVENEFYKNKKDNKYYIYSKYTFNINGNEKEEALYEVNRIKVNNGYEYHHINGECNGEYSLIDDKMNMFAINKEGKIFAKGKAL